VSQEIPESEFWISKRIRERALEGAREQMGFLVILSPRIDASGARLAEPSREGARMVGFFSRSRNCLRRADAPEERDRPLVLAGPVRVRFE